MSGDETTGEYTIPKNGTYMITGKISLNVGVNTNYYIVSSITLNSVVITSCVYSAFSGIYNAIVSTPCSDIIECTIGDKIVYNIYYLVSPVTNKYISNDITTNSLLIYKIGEWVIFTISVANT